MNFPFLSKNKSNKFLLINYEAVIFYGITPEGTGYGACREDIRLAGKTGTAELKATKEDTSGTEIGWFTVFTTDRDTKNPILLISMVENVKDIGGSGYVVEKDKAILDEYLGNE